MRQFFFKHVSAIQTLFLLFFAIGFFSLKKVKRRKIVIKLLRPRLPFFLVILFDYLLRNIETILTDNLFSFFSCLNTKQRIFIWKHLRESSILKFSIIFFWGYIEYKEISKYKYVNIFISYDFALFICG